jgi:hypothetical protein
MKEDRRLEWVGRRLAFGIGSISVVQSVVTKKFRGLWLDVSGHEILELTDELADEVTCKQESVRVLRTQLLAATRRLDHLKQGPGDAS